MVVTFLLERTIDIKTNCGYISNYVESLLADKGIKIVSSLGISSYMWTYWVQILQFLT